MTKLERKAWGAVADALDSIDGFAGGPKQVQAIGNAMSAICDLLDDDELNSKKILDSSPNKFPPAGFPCEVWENKTPKAYRYLAYADGKGKLGNYLQDYWYTWPHWKPAGLPEDAKPGEVFVYYNNGEVVRYRSRESWMDSFDYKSRYIYTVPEEATNE